MTVRRLILSFAAMLALLTPCRGQHATLPERMMEPFRQNYILTGLPLNTAPDYNTNDLVFQISARFNVAVLPHDWEFFLGYTQLSVWDVYMPSNPFRANTYSPGVYFAHEGRKVLWLTGYEHRSNGYASYESRSLDYGFVTVSAGLGRCFTAQATGRFGIGSIGNDFSLEMFTKYQGFVNVALAAHTPDKRLMLDVSASPLFGGDIPANLSAQLSWCPLRQTDWFRLTVRYHYGYDENQNDCGVTDVFLKHMLRFGLSIQPRHLSVLE